MLLLYLALAYAVGMIAGRWAWEAGLLSCDFPAWAWLVPVSLLPLAVWRHHVSRPDPATVAMRWPAWAGFEVPRTEISAGIWLALALCAVMGALRYAALPMTPCLAPADVGYWALPAEQAFDRAAPQFTIEGVIASYPLMADRRQRMYVTAHRLFMGDEDAWGDANQEGDGRPVAGLVRLNTDRRQEYAYGQPVRVTGRLVQPPQFEDFSYREYLAVRGVHSVIYDARLEVRPEPIQGEAWRSWLYALRSRGERLINRSLPEPYAALANGMLLGIEAGIPPEVYEQFNLTSTSHVIVISGSNVSIIVVVLLALSQAVMDRRRAVVVVIAGVAVYAALVGGDAAVTRAAIMGTLAALSLSLGRRSATLVTLAAAGWGMILFNPATLWDVSFQLSATATAGILLFVPIFNRWLLAWIPHYQPGPLLAGLDSQPTGIAPRLTGLLRGLIQDTLLVTMAAQIAVTPLLLLHFGRLSVTALAANFLIVPVQPYIMLWGSAAVLLGMMGVTALVPYLLWIPWLCLYWTWAVVQWFAAWEGDGLTWPGFGVWHAVALYALLGLFWAWAQESRTPARIWWERLAKPAWRRALHPTGAPVLTILGVAALLVWWVGLSQPDGRLHVYFLDVGQGDGIFIQTPSGRQVLIDGGISPQRLTMELGAVMPFWDRTLDMVVLTHPDSDHMAAQIETPRRYQVTYALDTAASQANPNGELWRAAIDAGQVEVALQHAGGWIDLGDGVALWVLWPPEGGYIGPDGSNENSLVLKLVYGHFSALLTGDAGLPSEMDLIHTGAPLQSSVLKVGHHGSRSSTGPDFVRTVQPWFAVIQVGENRYGHPHPEVLENLADHAVLRNDLHGRVHVWTDGAQMWVEAGR